MRFARLRAAARPLLASLAALLLAVSAGASAYRLSTGKAMPSLSYGPASQGWAGAVSAVAGTFSAGELAEMRPSLRSTLPTLGEMNAASIAARRSLGPVVFNIEKALEIPIEEFKAMTPAARKQVVALALEDSIRASEEAAYDLLGEVHAAMYATPGGVPGAELLRRLERIQREAGPLMGEAVREQLGDSYRAARLRARQAREERLREMMTETADALKRDVDPELLFTRQFSGDAKHFHDGDWERLGREFSKLRSILRSDIPRRGEIGNVKFLGGPLAGIGEFKFGANRTHRIYFRYRPEDDAVALLHYAPREHANNPARVYDKVRKMVAGGLDRDALPPDPEILELMASVEEADLNALGGDLFGDLPGGEPVPEADRAPEEGEPPPSPRTASVADDSLMDKAKRFFKRDD
jgi:hypothetical protein